MRVEVQEGTPAAELVSRLMDVLEDVPREEWELFLGSAARALALSAPPIPEDGRCTCGQVLVGGEEDAVVEHDIGLGFQLGCIGRDDDGSLVADYYCERSDQHTVALICQGYRCGRCYSARGMAGLELGWIEAGMS